MIRIEDFMHSCVEHEQILYPRSQFINVQVNPIPVRQIITKYALNKSITGLHMFVPGELCPAFMGNGVPI